MLFKRAFTGFLIILIAFAIAGVTYAYAAANTVPARKAGDGAAAIAAYTLTDYVYVLDSTNPQLIATVKFNLNADANYVKINLNNNGAWYTCDVTHSSPWLVTCSISETILPTNNVLRVVALSN
jgi:hypothetical protein